MIFVDAMDGNAASLGLHCGSSCDAAAEDDDVRQVGAHLVEDGCYLARPQFMRVGQLLKFPELVGR